MNDPEYMLAAKWILIIAAGQILAGILWHISGYMEFLK